MPSRRLIPLAVSCVLALAVPAGADAAPSLRLSQACYQDNAADTKATFEATGLPANAVLPVRVDGSAIGQVTTDASGTTTASFAVPPRSGLQIESAHSLTVGGAPILVPTPQVTTDGAPAPMVPVAAMPESREMSASFLSSAVAADFSPTQGDPLTMKVRFTASGMNLLKPSRVYVHYVDPSGKAKKTVLLGKAQGACGSLTSSKRRLFPFKPRAGQWTLQVDTAKKYRRATAKTTTAPWAQIGVRVQRPER